MAPFHHKIDEKQDQNYHPGKCGNNSDMMQQNGDHHRHTHDISHSLSKFIFGEKE
jgi:hypothetical protein